MRKSRLRAGQITTRRQSGLAEKADRGWSSAKCARIKPQAIASASPRPHARQTLRRQLDSAQLLEVCPVAQTHRETDSLPKITATVRRLSSDRRGGLGIEGNAFGFHLELIPTIIYFFSLLEAHSFRTISTRKDTTVQATRPRISSIGS